MKTRTIISVVLSICLSLLVLGGVASAASGVFDSITIGKQGVGGVTFFNGTIVNNTTASGKDNPVTFGDNVRIDGRIQRGTNSTGLVDTWNVIVDDGLEVNKTLAVKGTSTFTGKVTFNGGTNLDYAASNHNHDASYVSQANPQFNAQTGYISLPAASFTPDDTDAANQNMTYRRSGGIYPTNCASLPCTFSAPLNLPQGAVITGVKMRALDNNAAAKINLMVGEIGFIPASFSIFAQIDTTDAFASGNYQEFTTSSFTQKTVDNTKYSYAVSVSFNTTGPTTILADGVVTYTYNKP